MIGTTVAHYRVTGALGAGGMGEVWKAEDTKLGREVALKVLPEEFARDPNRMARFEREAKVLASLNHPNIATLYGLETAPSGTETETGTETVFLAMELVEGEDLSERVKRGPIPVEEAVAIALQIAEALEAAHEQGIVHRDLNLHFSPAFVARAARCRAQWGLRPEGRGARTCSTSSTPRRANTAGRGASAAAAGSW